MSSWTDRISSEEEDHSGSGTSPGSGGNTDDSKSGRNIPTPNRRQVGAAAVGVLTFETLREAVFQDQSPAGDTIWDGIGSVLGMRGLDQSYASVENVTDAAEEVSAAAVNSYLQDTNAPQFSDGATFLDGRYMLHTNEDDLETGQDDFTTESGDTYVHLTEGVFGDESILGDQFSIALNEQDHGEISTEQVIEELEQVEAEYREEADRAQNVKGSEFDTPSTDGPESLSDMEETLEGRLQDDDMSKGSTHYDMIHSALGDDTVDSRADRMSTVRGAMAYLDNQQEEMSARADVVAGVIDNLVYDSDGADPNPDDFDSGDGQDDVGSYEPVFDDVDHCLSDEEIDTYSSDLQNVSGGANPSELYASNDSDGDIIIRLGEEGPEIATYGDNC